MIKAILIVALGGACGSVARYLSQKYIYELHPHPFPFGTLLVNLIGCFLIGLFYGLFEKGNLLNPEWRLLLMTGFCGGFTTFSAFALENFQLLKSGQMAWFGLYTLGSLVLGLGCTWLGIILVRLF